MILCSTLCVSSCGIDPMTLHTDSYNNEKNSDIIELANFAKEQYDAEQLAIGAIITWDSTEEFEEYPDIAEIFSSNRAHKVTMRDENTVIIQTHIAFHTTHGYVITSEKSLDTYRRNGEGDPRLDVPVGMSYDGSNVRIDGYMGELNGLYLYHYTAGL